MNLSFTIFNVNTSTNLFTSSAGNQDFNATFTSGQVVRTIIAVVVSNCSPAVRSVMNLIIVVSALAILAFGISLFFFRGAILERVQPSHIVIMFVALIIGIVFIIAIADSVVSFCPT